MFKTDRLNKSIRNVFYIGSWWVNERNFMISEKLIDASVIDLDQQLKYNTAFL